MKKKTIKTVAAVALVTTAVAPIANLYVTAGQPGNTQIAKAVTNQEQQAFINKIKGPAQTASMKYGVYTSVMMAQAILESGWGTSQLSQAPYYNLFGIKGDYQGASVTMPTQEWVADNSAAGGHYEWINAAFRKYPSFTESFYDNGDKLRNGLSWSSTYYQGAWLENTDSYTDATAALQGKYATAPDYAEKLNNVITQNNLTQYDPQISSISGQRRVLSNVTTYNTFTGAKSAVGSLASGAIVNVQKLAKLYDGSQYAQLSDGNWVNNEILTTNTSQPPTPTPTTGVAKINYIPGYGIAVWNTPGGNTTGDYLKHGTSWKVFETAQYNGVTWYQVGGNQWIDGRYVLLNGKPGSNDNNNNNNNSGETTGEEAMSGVATVTYKWQVNLWKNSTGTNWTGRRLNPNTRWQVFAKRTVNGKTYYKLGTNQWVDGQYFTIS